MSDLPLFDIELSAPWEPVYAMPRCRDCGRAKFVWERGCGGAYGAGPFNLCDDCAALDDVETRPDVVGAEVSRWGIRTTEAERDGLRAMQARRRAKYLAERAA